MDAQCRVALTQYRDNRAPVLELLARTEKDFDLPFVRFDPVLCDTAYCRTSAGRVSLYRDDGHLSHDGSISLLQHPAMQASIRQAVQRSIAARQAKLTAVLAIGRR